MVKIEEGKSYVARNGNIFADAELSTSYKGYKEFSLSGEAEGGQGVWYFTDSGLYIGIESESDYPYHLVKEYVEGETNISDHAAFEELVDKTFETVKKLMELKGGEYSGDDDKLANFRRNAKELDLPMEAIWRIYSAKHWDAIGQYILDLKNGKTRERLETLDGRVDDLIAYLLLFKAMLVEREKEDQ